MSSLRWHVRQHGIYGCGVFRRAGVPLRFTACLVSCAPTGLCLMETCLILRTLACFLLRAQKYRKKLIFGEEKQFFHERLAGWEKGCIFAA
jgi:hypothetical protein